MSGGSNPDSPGTGASAGGDKSGSANAEVFQSSDLTKPSSLAEGWRKLAFQMQPSQGAGSGQIDAKSLNNDAQWLRAFSIIVYSHSTTTGGTFAQSATDTGGYTQAGGNTSAGAGAQQGQSMPGINLSNLRCTFSVQKQSLGVPNMLYARVYNLAPETLAKVIEFTRVQVMAGYHYANYGVIFDGEVVQYRRGKENPVDSYIEIHAADGDELNGGVLIKHYDEGTKQRQLQDDINKERQNLNQIVKVDHVDPNLFQDRYQRQSVAFRHIREMQRQLALWNDAQAINENGSLVIISKEGYRPGEMVILSPKTGLVGLPEVTPQGIQARCLLNPKLQLGGLVQIDTNILSGVAYVPGTASKVDGNGQVIPGDPAGGMMMNTNMLSQQMETAFTSPKGRYKILLMTYSGDTRGNPWYCDLVCVAMNSQNQAIVGTNQSNVWNKRASSEARKGTSAI